MKESEPDHSHKDSSEESEKIQEDRERISGASERIDEIARLVEEFRSWKESENEMHDQMMEKFNGITTLLQSDTLAKAVNEDLRNVIRHLHQGNWTLNSENLKKMRRELGSFVRGDKEAMADKTAINLILKEFPELKQKYDDLHAKMEEFTKKSKEALKAAEQKRVTLLQDILQYQDKNPKEVENIKKEYKEKLNGNIAHQLKS